MWSPTSKIESNMEMKWPLRLSPKLGDQHLVLSPHCVNPRTCGQDHTDVFQERLVLDLEVGEQENYLELSFKKEKSNCTFFPSAPDLLRTFFRSSFQSRIV